MGELQTDMHFTVHLQCILDPPPPNVAHTAPMGPRTPIVGVKSIFFADESFYLAIFDLSFHQNGPSTADSMSVVIYGGAIISP